VAQFHSEPLSPAIFLDRDGVINEMVYDPTHGLLDSPRRPEQVVGISFASDFIQQARALGYKIVIVTNQPGVAKQTLSIEELNAIHETLAIFLRPAYWDSLEFCPHHPEFGSVCECRKPRPGMILKSASELGIDLSKSWMIGDGLVDIQAGRAAGCRTILLTKLKINIVEKFFDLNDANPHFVARHLHEALIIIRGREYQTRFME